MSSTNTLNALRSGEITIRELRGITEDEMEVAIRAARALMRKGHDRAAAEVLAGLALYDPYLPGVWSALEELFRRACRPQQANLFAKLARAMVV